MTSVFLRLVLLGKEPGDYTGRITKKKVLLRYLLSGFIRYNIFMVF